ncbi:MAG: bifunctional phosphoribosylaminoimidazolecarboxamide formyltransferase/IMP cyclohydrolase [Deltaproteobacteria bacterium]|nr:bifunctional phosphoribosylaminoimidazolecarboxamide formyltransferase/IMP cyclohydrolase [Deltaproteobacteria bacterium]
MKKIKRAIISVTDKTGIAEFAKGLSMMGVEIISTGGTADTIKNAGMNVIPISSYTGFPEMLDGRVKTLHPKIHGGLLYVRDNPSHAHDMEGHGILPIDMVVVNLYAFEETVQRGGAIPQAIEAIDIGGPAMLRASAKNYRYVAAVADTGDYASIIKEMRSNGGALSLATRFMLAKKVFSLTARYDGAVSNWLGKIAVGADEGYEKKPDAVFPETFTVQYKKAQDLRYGENPHQRAAFYMSGNACADEQLQGKELSYNNILDLDAALRLADEFTEPAAVIIKHNNPCGAAISKEGLVKAYEMAFECDKTSAFGGILGFNRTVTEPLALALKDLFIEAVIAHSYETSALDIFKAKKNLRVIKAGDSHVGRLEIRTVSGGALIQDADTAAVSDLKIATKRGPTEEELSDMLFAWAVSKHVKSNAIILARHGRTLGIGAGQMSRIDSTRIALMKARDAGLDVRRSALASDGFFPFRDNIDMAAQNGITAIIQPGDSIKDQEVISAADEHNIAMVFTGMRHFRH